MADDLIKQLRQTRDDYAEELVWHRFLLDAYTGTGGFAGRIKQPATGYLGWAAEIYSTSSVSAHMSSAVVDTYLDRYPREDEAKFQRRKDVAHYPNYVEEIVDLLLSYVLKRDMVREKVPKPLETWMEDVDGQGTTWDEQIEGTLAARAALLGWCPHLIDADPVTEGATRAETDESSQTRSIPLFPANLLDWEADESGEFKWVKLRLAYTKREGPLDEAVKEEHYQLWTRKTVRKIVITKAGKGESITDDTGEVPNPFSVVPVTIWRHKPSPDDAVRGLGMVDGIASEVRRLFNLLSELDEHIRAQVFALLQVPLGQGEQKSELVLGTDNAVGIPSDAKHEYKYLAPPGSIAETLEHRIAETITEIHRLARTENDAAKSVSAVSGVARAYEFEKTNRRLGDFAKQLARSVRRAYKVVAKVLGLGDDALKNTKITAPTDFKVEDLETAIQNAISAVSLGLGPTAETRIKQRVAEKLLPNLPNDDKAAIEQELEDMPAAAEQEAAEQKEIDAAVAAEGAEKAAAEKAAAEAVAANAEE